MKPLAGVLATIAGFALAAASLPAQMRHDAHASSAAFEKIKSLAGEWDGKNARGPVRAKYEVVSGGNTVMETLQPQGESTMITMYHLDGGKLMMTHYCSSGNQPRMKAGALRADGKQVAFKFQDATNLASAGAGHMVALTLTFTDADHLTQLWTWQEKGQAAAAEDFTFVRRK